MITLEQAKKLEYGDHIYYVDAGRKGFQVYRVKVNGKPQTWKRNPQRVRIPCKYGLYQYFNLWHWDLDAYYLTEQEAKEACAQLNKSEFVADKTITA